MKVQQTILNLEKQSRITINPYDVSVLACGLLLWSLSLNSLAIGLNFVVMAYFYHRNMQQTLLMGLGFLFGMGIIGGIQLYQNMLLLCFVLPEYVHGWGSSYCLMQLHERMWKGSTTFWLCTSVACGIIAF